MKTALAIVRLLVAAMAILGTSVAMCQPALQPSKAKVAGAWQSLTQVDVDAAYRLLRDNHPASTPEAHDPMFVARLDHAHTQALARISSVNSMEGYAAVLREFANAMGDGHISTYLKFQQQEVDWAGVVVARRGQDWVIANEDEAIVGSDVIGAKLVSCDGIAIPEMARRVMKFRTVEGVEAMQIMRAGRLLLDDGNPFLHRPSACKIDQNGDIRLLSLHWQSIDFERLSKTYWKPAYGAAGFGVKTVGAGYWVAIEQLDTRAQAVINQVSSDAEKLRHSSFVVVDLRGNDGGDDGYGRRLAEALYGKAFVNERLGAPTDACPSVFRASEQNIASTRAGAAAFKTSGNNDAARDYDHATSSMEAARLAGRALTGPAECSVTAGHGNASSRPMMKAPVIILTDVACFSSCINTVGFFRKLGAIQVGQMTGADTHYSEVREITLPSGLSMFSTLMALMPDAPAHIGPYEPHVPYNGDIADTATLMAWIPAHALTYDSTLSRN